MPLIVAIKLVPYDSVATESRIATVKVLLAGKASVETQEQVHTFPITIIRPLTCSSGRFRGGSFGLYEPPSS